MKDLNQIEMFLLPSKFRRYGFLIMSIGIPLAIAIMSVAVISLDESTNNLLDNWSGYLFHIPISLGLFWVLFASEKDEDEMFLSMRLKATFHGIRFIFIAILFIPFLAAMSSIIFGKEESLKIMDIGGNLAVVSLLLLYANISYWYIKKKALENEE